MKAQHSQKESFINEKEVSPEGRGQKQLTIILQEMLIKC